jgi:hypothetical protein
MCHSGIAYRQGSIDRSDNHIATTPPPPKKKIFSLLLCYANIYFSHTLCFFPILCSFYSNNSIFSSAFLFSFTFFPISLPSFIFPISPEIISAYLYFPGGGGAEGIFHYLPNTPPSRTTKRSRTHTSLRYVSTRLIHFSQSMRGWGGKFQLGICSLGHSRRQARIY